jgi:AraC family transcriptional regulator, transcriptional activator of the genes for pyochelin and ferripyochelin receptors
MATVLTDEQYEALFEEQLQQGLAYECSTETAQEEKYHYGSPLFREGCDRIFHLRDGLDLRIWSFEPTVDVLITDYEHTELEPLSLSFFVRGDMHIQIPEVTQIEAEAAGSSYLMYCPGVTETEGWHANQKIVRVKVNIDPNVFLGRMSAEQLETLPPILQSFALGKSTSPLYCQGVVTAAMQTLLQQVLHCPYEGAMKLWYLEAKALELMTLQFDQLQGNTAAQKPRLKSQDIERIHRAQELLLQNLEHPPSLLELARWVETNDCTLKRGFKQVFGTTVFGYLHRHRLQVAQQLLTTSTLQVHEVARRVGFCDRNYFTRIFKQKFGLTPTEYRKQQKNSV